MSWQDDQKWEQSWWGNCANTFNEEYKQLFYARKMGLEPYQDGYHDPVYNLHGKKVLDIGGGPVSILLKCKNVEGTVVDPCQFPDWVYKRYDIAGIKYVVKPAEEYKFSPGVQVHFDEVWIYNVLQHTQDPEQIILNARAIADKIRIFEWVDTYVAPGHPHVLTEDKLNKWLGAEGKVEDVNQNNCFGKAYHGIFSYEWKIKK